MPKYLTKTLDQLPDLLTIGHSARILGCHTNTLRNWEREGAIQTIRIGKRKDRRFRKSDIMEMINSSEKC